MNKARQWYQKLTGAEPKNLAVLGPETSRKLAEQFAAISGDLNYTPALMEMEYLKVKRTEEGFFVRLIDVHRREDGRYSGINLDVGHVLLAEVGPAIRSLNIGDSATYCLRGDNVSEIVRKRKSYIHGQKQPSVQGKVDHVLEGQNLTEEQLVQDHTFEVRGNDVDGYVANVQVRNQYGIHARPAAMLVKTACKFDSDILIKKNGRTINAKSIMGVFTLEASNGTHLIFEAEGLDAKQSLEEIVGLFKINFGEEQ
ncbi:MAG: HPr family phosphocarrier protein [Nanoarchaeota archaeon]